VSLAYPEDILKKSHIASKRLISDFLQKLKSRYHFDRVCQDNDDSIYLSRLYTRVNGAINWNWDCIEIERFIRAFGRPYEGAWSFCRNKKIHIMDAIIDDDKEYHPFLSGRIVTVLNDNTVRIVAGRSAIRIRKIRIDESIINAGDYLKAGDIIYSNSDDIIKACNHKPTTSSMLK
jgi:methionyl-tRNA formyltransferase